MLSLKRDSRGWSINWNRGYSAATVVQAVQRLLTDGSTVGTKRQCSEGRYFLSRVAEVTDGEKELRGWFSTWGEVEHEKTWRKAERQSKWVWSSG